MVRILLVDGCSMAHRGYYEYICQLIERLIAQQHVVSDTELQTIKRDKADIEDFLFEPETSRHDSGAMQQFESLDLIVVVGDGRLQPWSSVLWPINCLIRMALRLNKYMLLVSDSVFESLVFHLCTGIITNVSLAGRKGVNEKQLPKPRAKTDMLLNPLDGALFGFNHQTDEWQMKKYCGLVRGNRQQKAANLIAPSCKMSKCKDILPTFHDEVLCQISRDNPYFNNLLPSFYVVQRSRWRVVGSVELLRNFVGWSKEQPNILQWNRILALHFSVDDRHQSTIQIVKNYLQQTLSYRERSREVMVRRERYQPTGLQVNKGRTVLGQKLQQQRPTSYHSGFQKISRPKTVNKMKSHENTLMKEQARRESFQENVFEEDEWAGPAIKIKTTKPLFKCSFHQNIRLKTSDWAAKGQSRPHWNLSRQGGQAVSRMSNPVKTLRTDPKEDT